MTRYDTIAQAIQRALMLIIILLGCSLTREWEWNWLFWVLLIIDLILLATFIFRLMTIHNPNSKHFNGGKS